ncbi:MAG: hypothetical protein ACXVEF_07340 [Polyangiales bacterium]
MKQILWTTLITIALAGCSSSTEAPSTPNTQGTQGGGDSALAEETATVDSGAAGTASDAASAGKFTATLAIPATFSGETTKLVVAAFSKLPVAGPPDGGILMQVATPKLTAGGTFAIEGDLAGITGNYYVLAVVYMKGGGNFSPKDGIDYDASTAKALSFDGKSGVDGGTLSLAIHHTGDGH